MKRKSIGFSTFKFFNRSQKEGNNFDHFQTELKKLVRMCEFGDKSDPLIQDRIIIGIPDMSLQRRLLRKKG